MLKSQIYSNEYWLTDENSVKLCPTARFVGGINTCLCDCVEPLKCKGVIREEENYKIKQLFNRDSYLIIKIK